VTRARYDGIADWYDLEFQPHALGESGHEAAGRLLGRGRGKLVDVGCGTGSHTVAFQDAGWTVTGVDVSADMLRRARERGLDVVQADATALPFDDATFDAAISIFTHTDVEDFAAVVREIARVLRPRAVFVYEGLHPCFCGPHTRYGGVDEIPILFDGYRRTGRYDDPRAFGPEGLRAKVGATHLPLGALLAAFLDAGFALEHVEEGPPAAEYPYLIASRWRR
jgi:SAM-dependent methyltransferase